MGYRSIKFRLILLRNHFDIRKTGYSTHSSVHPSISIYPSILPFNPSIYPHRRSFSLAVFEETPAPSKCTHLFLRYPPTSTTLYQRDSMNWWSDIQLRYIICLENKHFLLCERTNEFLWKGKPKCRLLLTNTTLPSQPATPIWYTLRLTCRISLPTFLLRWGTPHHSWFVFYF